MVGARQRPAVGRRKDAADARVTGARARTRVAHHAPTYARRYNCLEVTQTLLQLPSTLSNTDLHDPLVKAGAVKAVSHLLSVFLSGRDSYDVEHRELACSSILGRLRTPRARPHSLRDDSADSGVWRAQNS